MRPLSKRKAPTGGRYGGGPSAGSAGLVKNTKSRRPTWHCATFVVKWTGWTLTTAWWQRHKRSH